MITKSTAFLLKLLRDTTAERRHSSHNPGISSATANTARLAAKRLCLPSTGDGFQHQHHRRLLPHGFRERRVPP